jgi:hypothetical protein
VSTSEDETARGDLAQIMVPQAASLAMAVREETRAEITDFLGSMDRTELEALAVVLAAMVDPDRPLYEALAWVDFDEHGEAAEPFVPRASRRKTIRAVVRPPRLPAKARGVDMVAVERALTSHGVALNERERSAAIDLGIRSGLDYDQLSDVLGMDRKVVRRSWERIKKRARAQGIPVPTEPVGQIVPGCRVAVREAA